MVREQVAGETLSYGETEMKPEVLIETNPLAGLSFSQNPEEESSLRDLLRSHRREIIRLEALVMELCRRMKLVEAFMPGREP